MGNDSEHLPTFLETELKAYRAENDRLARELVLTRRIIGVLPSISTNGQMGLISTSLLLPRATCAGDDVLFHLDRYNVKNSLIHIEGWAFCPRIESDKAKLAILLESSGAVFLARPSCVQRPDVAAAYLRANLGSSHTKRSKLAYSGFSVLLEQAPFLEAGPAYQITIQIDGPEFSVRKSTGATLHV